MKRRKVYWAAVPLVVVVAVLVPLREVIATDWVELPEAYELIVEPTISALPAPLDAYFATRAAALRKAATDECVTAAGDATSHSGSAHHIKLDIGSDDPLNFAELTEAARRFPRDRTEAEALFASKQEADGGTLPWHLLERYGELTSAFRLEDWGAVERAAGRVMHYSLDAALPFNTRASLPAELDRDTWSVCGDRRTGECSSRYRMHFVVMALNRERLRHELRVWPGRFTHAKTPGELVFEALLAAHSSSESLAQQGLIGWSQVPTDTTLDDQLGYAYYVALADRLLPTMEVHYESGALLAANLIGTAWLEAGSPMPTASPIAQPISGAPESSHPPKMALESVPAVPTPAEGSRSAGASAGSAPGTRATQPTKRTVAAYFASGSSKIFHRAGCPHAERIRSENIVRYGSLAEAKSAGRSPCKTCKPDQG